MPEKVIVIPCSGIGKTLGTVSRLAAYYIVDKLLPDKTTTLCLPLLVIGDEEARKLVKKHPCVAIDGCHLGCAHKNIEASDGDLKMSFTVLEFLRGHRELKLGKAVDPISLGDKWDNGRKLAEIIGEKIADEIEKMVKG